ncbi:MAG: hypothetical protein GX493_08740 [Firmicutes bacterium]|nr:hypothetical protein [Bacillota bacterium]
MKLLNSRTEATICSISAEISSVARRPRSAERVSLFRRLRHCLRIIRNFLDELRQSANRLNGIHHLFALFGGGLCQILHGLGHLIDPFSGLGRGNVKLFTGPKDGAYVPLYSIPPRMRSFCFPGCECVPGLNETADQIVEDRVDILLHAGDDPEADEALDDKGDAKNGDDYTI